MGTNKISYYSLLYIAAWCISPPLAYGAIYRIIAIIAVAVVVFSSMGATLILLKSRLNQCILLCLYMLLVCFFTGESFVGKIGTFIILLTSVSFALWNYKYGTDIRKLNFLIIFIIALYCIWNTTTLIAVSTDGHIMRALVRNSDISVACAKRGIGGYGYVYSVVAMLPIGIYMLGDKHNVIIRAIIAYFVISGFVLSYMSQYFIALILSVLIFPMLYIANKHKGGMNMSSYIIVFGMLILFFCSLESILDFLINIVDTPSLKRKLIDMQYTLLYGGDVEDSEFGERYERYMRDINLILQSPLFGAFKYSAVGKHSSVLDFFAQYGIPLGIVFFKILFSSCTDWIKKKIPMASVVLWITLIIALMNQLPLSAAVPLSIALPAFCKISWLKSYSSITPA